MGKKKREWFDRGYSKHFKLLPFLHRMLTFKVTFHTPRGVRGKGVVVVGLLQANVWIFLPQHLWKHVFVDKKAQRKGRNRRKHNYIYVLQWKSRFICQRKNSVEFQNFKRLSIFVEYWTYKKAWNNSCMI